MFALPLLISAQTWYVFSYVNSEGFAIIVSTIISYQVAFKESALNKLLRETESQYIWLRYILFGLMFGVLLLLKENFYVFIVFLGLYLLWRIIFDDLPNNRTLWFRLIVISLIACSLYGLRFALDYRANGPDRDTKIAEMVEQKAQIIYKPSTPLEHKHIYLYLKDRGFSLDRLISKEHWDRKSLITAFGAYGYTQFFSSQAFYDLVRNLGLAIVGLMLFGVLINGSTGVQTLFLIVGGCSVLLVTLLLLRSWTISFQPQGRYFAPLLPMLGILYYHARPHIYQKLVVMLTIGMFLLATYSFIFIGLHEVKKSAFFV